MEGKNMVKPKKTGVRHHKVKTATEDKVTHQVTKWHL